MNKRYRCWLPEAMVAASSPSLQALPLAPVFCRGGGRFTADGRLHVPDAPNAPQAVDRGQASLFLQVRQRGPAGEVLAALAQAPAARARLLQDLLSALARAGADGIALALQGPFPGQRDDFVALIEELAWELRRQGRSLAVIAPPQLNAPEAADVPEAALVDPQRRWQATLASYDFASLGVYADVFVIAAWEFLRKPRLRAQRGDAAERGDAACFGGSVDPALEPGEPGVLAPLSWLEMVLDHALATVPPRSIVLGLPLLGRVWDARRHAVHEVPFAWSPQGAEAVEAATLEHGERRLVIRADEQDAHRIVQEAYLETLASFERKAALVKAHDLGGLAVRAAAPLDERVFDALARAFSAADVAKGPANRSGRQE